MDLKTMYPGAVNSPETLITNAISATETTLTVQSADELPPPPCLLVLGGNLSNAETVWLIGVSENTLTVERGFQGTAIEWPQGTTIACNFTEAHYSALVENIQALSGMTPADIGAAQATHTHTPAAIGAAAAVHIHTPADAGAAPENHTHTPAAIGAAAATHTHHLADATQMANSTISVLRNISTGQSVTPTGASGAIYLQW